MSVSSSGRTAEARSAGTLDGLATLQSPVAELQLGVLSAPDSVSRARRADTLALARTADPIPLSESVMVSWARLVADCRAVGIHRTVKLTDALIAATAVEHGLAVVTRDDDYDRLAAAHSALRVIQVEQQLANPKPLLSAVAVAQRGSVRRRGGDVAGGGAAAMESWRSADGRRV